ncbi:MAG: carbohydrate ABC transporter permease [Devosia sp.]
MKLLSYKLLSRLGYLFVGLYALFTVLPIGWMVFAAFKEKRELFISPLSLPETLRFTAFADALDVGLVQFIINSVIVTGLTVIVIVTFAGLAAYALARSKSWWSKLIYLAFVAAFAVPIHGLLVPLFTLLNQLGLANSQLGIVLPYAAYGIPFTVILLYAFFLEFPTELEEAARLDGCNRLQIFIRVVLPLSGPAAASAALFQAVFTWNEFLVALMMLTNNAVKTLPVGIFALASVYTSNWPALMAALSIGFLPILVLFFVFQKYFVRSLAGLGK